MDIYYTTENWAPAQVSRPEAMPRLREEQARRRLQSGHPPRASNL